MVCRKFINRVTQTLKPLVGNTDFTVKNSLDFCDQIKQVKLEEGGELVSFDVVSLFTSIPVELAIQVATDVLSKDDTLQDRTAIPVEDIVDLFCQQQILSTTIPTTNRFLALLWALLCQALWQTWSWIT